MQVFVRSFLFVCFGLGVLGSPAVAGAAQQVVLSGFDDVPLGPESYYVGGDGAGGFVSGGARFTTGAYTNWWEGFACSNTTDTTTPGYLNQFSAVTGSGYGGSANYAVTYTYYNPAQLEFLNGPQTVAGAFVTNTTYALLSMRDGDGFTERFGGVDGTDPDWFRLRARGYGADGSLTGEAVFYLADFRFADDRQDYILDDWAWFDLTALGPVSRIEFRVSASDFGVPAYFAMDELMGVVP